MTAKFTVIIGRLLCRDVRDFLKMRQFEGYDIKFWESSGLIERTFMVRGEASDVADTLVKLTDWAKSEGVYRPNL